MIEMGGVGEMDRADAGDLGRRICHRPYIISRDQRVDLAKLRSGGDGRECRILDLPPFVLDVNESFHCTTPRAFNFPTSSSTEPTLSPACLFGGSATLSVSKRREASTPSSSGLV